MNDAPAVAEAHNSFGDDVLFIGMAGRGGREESESFVLSNGVDGFPHTFDADAESWSEFDQFLVPAYVFIDDDGTVTTRVGSIGEAKLRAMLTGLTEN